MNSTYFRRDRRQAGSARESRAFSGKSPQTIAFGAPAFSVRSVALAPENVQLIGDELAVRWSDGDESYLPLELLRRACPCASCGGEPDVLGNVVRPHVRYTTESFQLSSWNLVGGYAIQPRWSDGHSTGLYSYLYLRRLAGAQR